jgi:hypothetical protein
MEGITPDSLIGIFALIAVGLTLASLLSVLDFWHR